MLYDSICRQGIVSKYDKFQTSGFHLSSSLNQFTSSNNRYVQKPKQTRFTKPGSQYDRAVVRLALATHPGPPDLRQLQVALH